MIATSAWVIFIIVAAVIAVIGWLAWFLRDEMRQIGEFTWMIWCLVYVSRWRLRFTLQNFFVQTASGVLLAGSFYIFLELALVLIRTLAGSSDHVDQGRSDNFVGRHLTLLPTIDAPPLWVEAMLVFLAVLVFRHHWQEWKHRKREAAVPAELKTLIDTIRPLLRTTALEEADKSTLWETTMTELIRLLSIGRDRWGIRRKKYVFCASLMKVDDSQTKLTVSYVYPAGTDLIDSRFILSVNKSAAGLAYKTETGIYVPSTRHLGGVNVKTYRSVGLVYDREKKVDPGPSLMCIPVGDSGRTTVLNISCNRRNAFGPLDFSVAGVVAAMLAFAN